MSTLAVTLTGIAPATLTIDLGTPGPQGLPGPTGSQGPTGPAGAPGVGVPAGGLTGQYLVKTSNADFLTGWSTLSLNYLPLAGGAMDVDATITLEDTTVDRVSEVAGFGFSVSSASNINLKTNVLFDRVSVANVTSATSIIPTGVEFPDLTIQTSAGISAATAAATYQTLAGMSSYLTTSAAASTYYLQTNPSGFITSSALTPYLLSSTAASTYQTLAGMSSYLTTATAATTYAPIAAGLPTGGTVGQVLTKQSGANFDASFATIIPGDRYLTTSTTSLAIDNANKTLTVGTGLSYTPTQNITISYNASNHMHGEVLTYNSGTGVLTVDVNNHTGTGTYSSWVVNVGGVTPATSVAWGAITGTLGDQTDLATALNNKLEVSTAASTYYLQTNPSGFIGDAPSDGSTYGRNNGAWAVAGGGGLITSVTSPLSVTSGDLSVDLSTYLTTSAASSTYLPFTGGTMSGLLTSESGTTIAGMNYDGFTATQAGDYSGSLSATIMQVDRSEVETYGTGTYSGSVTRNAISNSYSGYDSWGAMAVNATMSYSGGFTGGFSSVPANGTYSLTANGIAGTQTNYGTTSTFAYGPNGVAWNNGSVYGTFDASGVRFADGTTQTTACTVSAPPYYYSVWAYGNWYSASTQTIEIYGTYYNFLVF